MLICRPLGTVWAGVANAQAVNVIAQMQPGDRWIIYHVGDERRVVGIAAVTTAADGDPRVVPAKLKVVDVVPVRVAIHHMRCCVRVARDNNCCHPRATSS